MTITVSPQHGFSNVPYAILEQAVTNTDAMIRLITGGVSRFVPGWRETGRSIYLTLTDPSHHIEIVKVTRIYGDVFTVERGQDGTTARAWPVGSIVCQRGPSTDINMFLQKGVYRSSGVNPNSTVIGTFSGEKIYQTGPSDCEKRWFTNNHGTFWDLHAGVACPSDPGGVDLPGGPPGDEDVSCLAHNGNGMVVSVHNSGGILEISYDYGDTWSKRVDTTLGRFWGLAYGNGVWVLIVNRYDSSGGVYTSSDCITWTWVEPVNGAFSPLCVCFCGDKFVMGGAASSHPHIQTSNDGVNWVDASLEAPLPITTYGIEAIGYDGASNALACGNRMVYNSSGDLSSWAFEAPSVSDCDLYAITYGSGKWVVIGDRWIPGEFINTAMVGAPGAWAIEDTGWYTSARVSFAWLEAGYFFR